MVKTCVLLYQGYYSICNNMLQLCKIMIGKCGYQVYRKSLDYSFNSFVNYNIISEKYMSTMAVILPMNHLSMYPCAYEFLYAYVYSYQWDLVHTIYMPVLKKGARVSTGCCGSYEIWSYKLTKNLSLFLLRIIPCEHLGLLLCGKMLYLYGF